MMDRANQRADDESLRREYASAMGGGSPSCPGDETLAGLVSASLEGPERLRLADHVVECRRCAETCRDLLALDAAAGGSRRRAAPRRAWLALAASLGALALGAWLFTRGPAGPGNQDALRGEPPAVAPVGGALLAASPGELRWPALAGATAYRVRLFDAAAELVWEVHGLTVPRAEIPAGVTARLERGESYFWVVEGEGLLRQASLGPYWFSLVE